MFKVCFNGANYLLLSRSVVFGCLLGGEIHPAPNIRKNPSFRIAIFGSKILWSSHLPLFVGLKSVDFIETW